MKQFFFLISTLFSFYSFSQNSVEGEIRDAITKDVLPFVHVIANENGRGTATNIDGEFTLESNGKIRFIQVSYVGYEKQTFTPRSSGKNVILLKKVNFSLRAVNVYPGENPAHAIIQKTYANSDKNNPMKSGAFEYDTYMKMKGIIDMDSVAQSDTNDLDSFSRAKKKKGKKKATKEAVISFLETSDIFIMETVTHRKFRPHNFSKETVIATKISGFKNPNFGLLTSQMGSFTFYDEKFVFGNREYKNPISKNSINKYLFILEDTTFSGQDSTFIISFRPRQGKKFDGLKGLLYINSNGYALENVIAEPTEYLDGVNVSLQQSYELVEGKRWFPSEIKTDFTMMLDTIDTKVNFVGTLRGFFLNIKLDPVIPKKEFSHIAVEIDPMASKKPDSFWEDHRISELTEREKTTYVKVDSLSKEFNIERNFFVLNSLLSSVVPYKFIDFDLDRVFRFNRYEGYGLGLGIHTNGKLSKHFKLGGYFNYGFGDKTWKYGCDFSYLPIKGKELEFNASYIKDVVETGGTEWYIKTKSGFSSAAMRPFFISLKDERERYQFGTQFRTLNYLQTFLFANYDLRKTMDNSLYYNELVEIQNTHTTAEIGIHLRYAYGESYVPINGKIYSKGTKSPIFHFKYTHGISGVNLGDIGPVSQYDYNKIDFKIIKLFKWRALGKSAASLNLGYSDANLPKTFLYNAPATYYSELPIAVGQSFQTMRANEYFAEKYSHLFLSHTFPKINTKLKWFKPTPVIYHNMGIGELSGANKDKNSAIQDYSNGYFESGVGINNLYSANMIGYGISVMYRYGSESLPYEIDNWAIKFSFGISLDFGGTTSLEF